MRKQLKNQRKSIEKREEPYENAPNKPMRFKKIFDASSATKGRACPLARVFRQKDGRKDSKKDEWWQIREMDSRNLTQSRAEVHQNLRAAAGAPMADKPQTTRARNSF